MFLFVKHCPCFSSCEWGKSPWGYWSGATPPRTRGGPAPSPASAVLHRRDMLGHGWAQRNVSREGSSPLFAHFEMTMLGRTMAQGQITGQLRAPAELFRVDSSREWWGGSMSHARTGQCRRSKLRVGVGLWAASQRGQVRSGETTASTCSHPLVSYTGHLPKSALRPNKQVSRRNIQAKWMGVVGRCVNLLHPQGRLRRRSYPEKVVRLSICSGANHPLR